MEYMTISILIIIAMCVILFLTITHIPKMCLTAEIKRQILDNGLIHFTMWENAEKIQQEGLIPDKQKAMNRFEKNMVWMYINNAVEFQNKYKIVHSKGNRKGYDAVVLFQNVKKEQLENMRYRKSDMAIVFKGTFATESISIKKVDDNEI